MTIRRPAIMMLVFANAFLTAVASPAVAQDASPAASPEAPTDCTAELGLVRSTKACVAFVHASPDAPAVDVYLNGEVAVTALAPNSATRFVELSAGDYRFQAVPTDETSAQAVVSIDRLSIQAGRTYEVAAIGYQAEMRTAVFDVSHYAVPASDAGLPHSRVRVVHTAVDGKAIDAALIAGADRIPWIDDLDFASAGAYVEAPAGTYRLVIAAFWGESLLEEPDFTLEPDTVTSVYVVWSSAGTRGLKLVVVTTSASRLPAPDATPQATPAA